MVFVVYHSGLVTKCETYHLAMNELSTTLLGAVNAAEYGKQAVGSVQPT